MWRSFLPATSLALIVSASALSAQPSGPCAAEPYRALDFWVGEWRVVDDDGETVGTNHIAKVQGGCLIEENWTSARGGTGQSMNYYDPAAGLWKQHWVDARGTVVHYAGTVEEGVLVYEGQHIRADGTVTMARVRLEPIESGRLHHLIEHSPDGGGTWTSYFDATYLPVGGQLESASVADATESPRPATTVAESPSAGAIAAAEPAEEELPAAEPAAETPAEPSATASESKQDQAARQALEEGSEVTAISRVLGREEIPEEQAPELRMASPMVLEIVPGPLDALREDTAWPTDKTKGFICNDIVVKTVTAARRGKGDKVELEVAARLYTAKRIRRVDLLVEVVLGDRVVASEELENIRVGLNIPAHGKEGLWVSAEMTVSRQEFEQLFAEGADRKLRLTLTTPPS